MMSAAPEGWFDIGGLRRYSSLAADPCPTPRKDDLPMRMMLPPIRERRQVHRLLSSFFHAHTNADFNKAISSMCRFYNLKRPRVEWFEYLDWGRSAGKTYEDGKIHLVHPENWKRGRKYNSERQWINAVYHEMGHYVFWADAERKADTFAFRMARGVNGNHRNGNTTGMRTRA
jgi:hypothetical protein